MVVESGEIYHRPQISCLLWDQEQPAVVPVGCHVGDPLYGPLQQQGIHGLLKVLPAVSGPEADALMGELRSMLECNAHPVLDIAGCPADSASAGQSLPGEPPLQRCLVEEAAEDLPGFFRASGKGGSCVTVLWVVVAVGDPRRSKTNVLEAVFLDDVTFVPDLDSRWFWANVTEDPAILSACLMVLTRF